MSTRKETGAKAKTERAPRASVTFPPELYESLGLLAKKKKVSIAWVVRDAAERYVAGETVTIETPRSDKSRRKRNR